MDDLKQSAKPEDDELRRLKAEFVADLRSEEDWRRDKVLYGQFYDGEQLTPEEKTELDRRGQPPVVINRIKPKMDSIFGIQLGLRVDTKAYPVGDKENEAEEISEELRRIEDSSAFDDIESLAFEDMCIDGLAWYEACKYYAPLRSLENLDAVDELKLVDNDSIVLDRNTRKEDKRTGELKSSKRIHKHAWMDLEDALGLFPDSKDDLEKAVQDPDMYLSELSEKLKRAKPDQYKSGEGAVMGIEKGFLDYFVDPKAKRVRVVTTHRRVPSYQKILFHKGGFTDVTAMSKTDLERISKELEDVRSWSQVRHKLNVTTFTWNAILEKKLDIRPYDDEGKFPYFMAQGYLSRDGNKFFGLVKQHLDPQREVNKRRSKMLHLLNTSQTWFEDGAFEDEAKAKEEIVRPDAWVKRRQGFNVERVNNQELATAQFQLLQESKQEIDTAGVNREVEGNSAASSGYEFKLRQQQSMQSIRKLFMNLRAARRRANLYMLEEILERSPELAAHVRQYDIVIEEAPDSINLQSETFDKLVQLASAGAAIPPDLILEMSPLPKDIKDKIVGRMQEAQAAQAQALQMQQSGGAPAPAQAVQ